MIISGPNENSPKASISVIIFSFFSSVIIISGPNENSPKARMSVYVFS